MKVFFVCGPKRSGTHLVSSWLLAMAGGGEFVNSPLYEGEDGFLKFSRLHHAMDDLDDGVENVVVSTEIPHWLTWSDQEQCNDAVILSDRYEIDVFWLYVMREPGNWLASRLKWSERQDLSLNKMLRFHEDEYLLNWGKFTSSHLQVAYDSFVAPGDPYSSRGDGHVYRCHLAEKLGADVVRFDEDTDKSIMSQLHGRPWANPPSSWDTEAIESKQMSVRDMPVAERWRNIVGLLKHTSETTRRIARQYWRAEWPDIIEGASNDQATSRLDKP